MAFIGSVHELMAIGDDVTIADSKCRALPGSWDSPEVINGSRLNFTRGGCFERRARGRRFLHDSNTAHFENHGDEQQIAHPHGGGESLTSIRFSETCLTCLTGESRLPDAMFYTPPDIDLKQRYLLVACAQEDSFAAAELAFLLLELSLRWVDPDMRFPGSQGEVARHRLVDDARLVLAENPSIGLASLSKAVSASPNHLSRTFKSLTGQTISAYRNRLRTRLALERLAEGEDHLATLAVELGFSDHSHMTNTIRKETGRSPGYFRDIFQGKGSLPVSGSHARERTA